MGNNALSKAEQNALAVSYEVLGTRVELDLQELVFFMNTCKMQGLNPLAQGEVYLIKYSKDDPAQMVVGKDAYLRRAYSNPDYLYKNDGIVVQRGQEIIQKAGCCLYPGETLIGGWCRVYFLRNGKERETFKEVSFSEYNKGQANWKSKPATMINKVAISQCVRDAFPKDYEGLYSEDEMVASGAIPADYTVIDGDQPPVEDDTPITQDQRQMLFATAQKVFGKEVGNQVVKGIIEEIGLTSTVGMTQSQYERVTLMLMDACEQYRNAHPPEDGEVPDGGRK